MNSIFGENNYENNRLTDVFKLFQTISYPNYFFNKGLNKTQTLQIHPTARLRLAPHRFPSVMHPLTFIATVVALHVLPTQSVQLKRGSKMRVFRCITTRILLVRSIYICSTYLSIYLYYICKETQKKEKAKRLNVLPRGPL